MTTDTARPRFIAVFDTMDGERSLSFNHSGRLRWIDPSLKRWSTNGFVDLVNACVECPFSEEDLCDKLSIDGFERDDKRFVTIEDPLILKSILSAMEI